MRKHEALISYSGKVMDSFDSTLAATAILDYGKGRQKRLLIYQHRDAISTFARKNARRQCAAVPSRH